MVSCSFRALSRLEVFQTVFVSGRECWFAFVECRFVFLVLDSESLKLWWKTCGGRRCMHEMSTATRG